MNQARASFEKAIAAFRTWAAKTSGRFGEWECDYEGWPVVWATFEKFLQSSEPEQWDQSTTELVLYILARDNEMEELKNELTGHSRHLLTLAKAGIHSAEQDARWQLADALGNVHADEDEVVPILEAYAADRDEYVIRRALLALGRRRSSVAEVLAAHAWDTGHEYQRIAALEVLSTFGSPLLSSYLEQAAEDGRQYVVGAAERIRSSLGDSPKSTE